MTGLILSAFSILDQTQVYSQSTFSFIFICYPPPEWSNEYTSDWSAEWSSDKMTKEHIPNSGIVFSTTDTCDAPCESVQNVAKTSGNAEKVLPATVRNSLQVRLLWCLQKPDNSQGSGRELKVWGFRAVRSDVCRRKKRRSSLPTAQHGLRPNSGGWYTWLRTFLDIRTFTHPTQGTSREWSLDYTSINSLAAQPDFCTAGMCLQRQRYMWLMEQSLHLRREKRKILLCQPWSPFLSTWMIHNAQQE